MFSMNKAGRMAYKQLVYKYADAVKAIERMFAKARIKNEANFSKNTESQTNKRCL